MKDKILIKDENGDLLHCRKCYAVYFAHGNFSKGKGHEHNCEREREWRMQQLKDKQKSITH